MLQNNFFCYIFVTLRLVHFGHTTLCCFVLQCIKAVKVSFLLCVMFHFVGLLFVTLFYLLVDLTGQHAALHDDTLCFVLHCYITTRYMTLVKRCICYLLRNVSGRCCHGYVRQSSCSGGPDEPRCGHVLVSALTVHDVIARLSPNSNPSSQTCVLQSGSGFIWPPTADPDPPEVCEV